MKTKHSKLIGIACALAAIVLAPLAAQDAKQEQQNWPPPSRPRPSIKRPFARTPGSRRPSSASRAR